VQIDIKVNRIGLRYLVDVGLVGDTASTLRAFLSTSRKKDDAFLLES
jgi:thiamine pyrophosphate-dependent acetolactate synthase large subunit-like protein